MKKRLITIAMAACVLFSFVACDFSSLFNKQTEATTEPTESETTTTVETTTEETTEEPTTTDETTEETTSEEASVSTESSVAETTKAPTKKPTSKPKKSSAPSVPKGWKKLDTSELWGQKQGGKRIYVIYTGVKNADLTTLHKASIKGWKNGKWVKLKWVPDDESSGSYFYEKNGKLYCDWGF